MNPNVGLDSAYRQTLADLRGHGQLVPAVQDPTSITTGFGAKAKNFYELRGYTFSIANPRQRLVSGEGRKASEQFCVANFLWMLFGRDDHEFIGHYNQKGAALAEVDGHYPGAHGRRIGNQLFRVIDELRAEHSSRRAVLQVSREEDLFSHSRDIPCVIAIQLFRRPVTLLHTNGTASNALHNEALDMVVHMRSQNAVFVMPYDIYAFTMFQEFIASALGIQVGTYHHQVGSLHFFEGEEGVVDTILNERPPQAEFMTTMPAFTSPSGPRQLIHALEVGEKQVRDLGPFSTDSSFLPTYWINLLNKLWIPQTNSVGIDIAALSKAGQGHSYGIHNRHLMDQDPERVEIGAAEVGRVEDVLG